MGKDVSLLSFSLLADTIKDDVVCSPLLVHVVQRKQRSSRRQKIERQTGKGKSVKKNELDINTDEDDDDQDDECSLHDEDDIPVLGAEAHEDDMARESSSSPSEEEEEESTCDSEPTQGEPFATSLSSSSSSQKTHVPTATASEGLQSPLVKATALLQLLRDTEIAQNMRDHNMLHDPDDPPEPLNPKFLEQVLIPLVRAGLIAAAEAGCDQMLFLVFFRLVSHFFFLFSSIERKILFSLSPPSCSRG